MISIFNGITYDIPEFELKEFKKWLKEEWEPVMKSAMITDNGSKRIPTNIRALSFTQMLKDKYNNEWAKYKI